MFIHTFAYNASIIYFISPSYKHGKITASISTIIYQHKMEKYLMVTLCVLYVQAKVVKEMLHGKMLYQCH